MTKREYVWALVRTTVALSLMALALWGGDLASWAYSSLDAYGIRILIGATALALLGMAHRSAVLRQENIALEVTEDITPCSPESRERLLGACSQPMARWCHLG